MYIMIYESLKITDEAEMQAVLEVVAQSEYYSEEIYGTVSMMKAQWIAHNIAYEMATGSAEERDLAVAIAGESLSMIIKRSKELDLSPIAYMSPEEKTLYAYPHFQFTKANLEYLAAHPDALRRLAVDTYKADNYWNFYPTDQTAALLKQVLEGTGR